jgi:hypothetical protein
MRDIFKPVHPLEILMNLAKGFLSFWLILLAPVALGLLANAYMEAPILGIVSAYGLLGILVAIFKRRNSQIRVTSDLRVETVKAATAHPELLPTTLIVNAIFAVQVFFIWLIL